MSIPYRYKRTLKRIGTLLARLGSSEEFFKTETVDDDPLDGRVVCSIFVKRAVDTTEVASGTDLLVDYQYAFGQRDVLEGKFDGRCGGTCSTFIALVTFFAFEGRQPFLLGPLKTVGYCDFIC